MARKKLREGHELDSLIPSIKSAEKNLDDLLAGVRAEAAELVQSAETEAARRIQRSREEAPALLARERESRMVSLRARAAEQLEAAREETRGLEKKAAGGMEAAVRLIVSRGLAGGGEMISPMAAVEILGPIELFNQSVDLIQDSGSLHIVEAPRAAAGHGEYLDRIHLTETQAQERES